MLRRFGLPGLFFGAAALVLGYDSVVAWLEESPSTQPVDAAGDTKVESEAG